MSRYFIPTGLALLLSVSFFTANAQDAAEFSLPNTLQECLAFDEALSLSASRDPNVLIAKAGEREADAAIIDARALYRPQVSAFGRTGVGDTGAVDIGVSNQVGVRASQRVLDFGDAKYARRAAKSNYAASLKDTQFAKGQAALETGLTWLEMREAQEQLKLTEARQNYFAQQVAAVSRALERGGATRTERASVASQLADAESFILELEFRKDQAETQLLVDTGQRGNPCRSDESLERRSLPLESVAAARDMALSSNPEIEALRKRSDALEAEQERQKRARLPIIDVVATGSYASFSAFDDFRFQERIGLDVSVPIYAGNTLKAGNQRAGARVSIARGQALDAERRLKENTEITVRRIKSLEKQLRARLEVEKQTRLQFEAAEIEQAAGTRTLRELIDIRLEFEQAGLEVIRTRYDSLRQRLQLLALTAQLPI